MLSMQAPEHILRGLGAMCAVTLMLGTHPAPGQVAYEVGVQPEAAPGPYSPAEPGWWLGQRLFHHRDPDDPMRYVGWGQPLYGTSWRNRPYHVGWDVGILWGEPLIDGRTQQGDRVMGAYCAGWDFDHYWGTELRLAFAYLEVIDAGGSVLGRDSRNLYGDAHLLYYPWGDARWRPYASLGLGLAGFRFQDDLGRDFNEVLLGVPMGLGVKYQARRWLGLRLELTDNLAVSAAGLSTMHNVSLTGGVEVHFGNRPTVYW